MVITTTIARTATIAKITWRVTNVYGSTVRVRVAEKTMKHPATVSANWLAISTQSMFRLGSAGLERMLPSPESGLRCSIESPTGQSGGRTGASERDMHPVSTSRRSRAATVEPVSSVSETSTGSTTTRGFWERARKTHFTTGAAPVEPKPAFSRYDTTVYGPRSGWT